MPFAPFHCPISNTRFFIGPFPQFAHIMRPFHNLPTHLRPSQCAHNSAPFHIAPHTIRAFSLRPHIFAPNIWLASPFFITFSGAHYYIQHAYFWRTLLFSSMHFLAHSFSVHHLAQLTLSHANFFWRLFYHAFFWRKSLACTFHGAHIHLKHALFGQFFMAHSQFRAHFGQSLHSAIK
jgi:hypothetical protein